VDSLKCVWNGESRLSSTKCTETESFIEVEAKLSDDPYGCSRKQLEMLNGISLHEKGFRGQGMRIAVIDAGFENVNKIKAFEKMLIKDTRNISNPENSIYCENNHGTKTLSCLAANLPGIIVGSAPDATYLLIKSEVSNSESPIEEDFWAAAVEYADSMGVDIISSSLGYYRYDSIQNYYSHNDLDGQTAFASRIAEIAAQKGILLVISAGNEGAVEWSKITFPADANDVLTVGSINKEYQKSTFSSVGLTADGRIKPDVVALGTGVCVIDSDGSTYRLNGTSFSTPLIAGLAACLWQAFPQLKNTELIKLIQESSSQSQNPDYQLGYGIPDFFKAYNKVNDESVQ